MENKSTLVVNQLQYLREQTLQFGREVAALYTATQFPDWVLIKIGTNVIQSCDNELNKDYCEGLIEGAQSLIDKI